MLTTTSQERPGISEHPEPLPERREADAMPLTAALLTVASKGLSFATPGHRCGRSCTPER